MVGLKGGLSDLILGADLDESIAGLVGLPRGIELGEHCALALYAPP